MFKPFCTFKGQPLSYPKRWHIYSYCINCKRVSSHILLPNDPPDQKILKPNYLSTWPSIIFQYIIWLLQNMITFFKQVLLWKSHLQPLNDVKNKIEISGTIFQVMIVCCWKSKTNAKNQVFSWKKPVIFSYRLTPRTIR